MTTVGDVTIIDKRLIIDYERVNILTHKCLCISFKDYKKYHYNPSSISLDRSKEGEASLISHARFGLSPSFTS